MFSSCVILGRSFVLMSVFLKSHFANLMSVSFGILPLQVVKQPAQTGLNSKRNSLALSIEKSSGRSLSCSSNHWNWSVSLSLSLPLPPSLPPSFPSLALPFCAMPLLFGFGYFLSNLCFFDTT